MAPAPVALVSSQLRFPSHYKDELPPSPRGRPRETREIRELIALPALWMRDGGAAGGSGPPLLVTSSGSSCQPSGGRGKPSKRRAA